MADIYQFVLPPRRNWTCYEAQYFRRLQRLGQFGLLVPFDPNGPRRKVPRRRLLSPHEFKRLQRAVQRYLATPEDPRRETKLWAGIGRLKAARSGATRRGSKRRKELAQ